MSDEKKVIRLVPAREVEEAQKEVILAKDQEEIVEMLTEILERARAGDFTAMVGVFDLREGGFCRLSSQSAQDDIFKTIGQLELVKSEFVHIAHDLVSPEELDE